MTFGANILAFNGGRFTDYGILADNGQNDIDQVAQDADIRETFRILDQGINRRFMGQNENID